MKDDEPVVTRAKISGIEVEFSHHGMQPGRVPTCGIFCIPVANERALVALCGRIENVLAFIQAVVRLSRGTIRFAASMLRAREGESSAFGSVCLGFWPDAAKSDICLGFARLGPDSPSKWATYYVTHLHDDPRREPGARTYLSETTTELVRELFDHQCASALN